MTKKDLLNNIEKLISNIEFSRNMEREYHERSEEFPKNGDEFRQIRDGYSSVADLLKTELAGLLKDLYDLCS